MIELSYSQPPGFLAIYRRLIFGRRPAYVPGTDLPPFRSTWREAKADRALVERYCAACSLPFDGTYPILYPHILTSAIHLDMMSQPEFPLSPMGALHARNHIVQHRPIPLDATLDITCELTATRVIKQGVEFEVSTILILDGAACWESISAYLVRGKKFGDPGEPSPRAELPDISMTSDEYGWDVPREMGWRYAKITGDYNPIHVSRIMAKFLGFDRDLIHGMWSAARCLGHSPSPEPAWPVQLDLIFKGPVYMESAASMKSQTDNDGTLFDLYCGDNPRPCIRGRLQPVAEATCLTATDV